MTPTTPDGERMTEFRKQDRTMKGSWKPIIEAPKDGTEIIGIFWRRYDDSERPIVYGPWTVRFRQNEWQSSWDNEQVVESQSDWGTDYKRPDIQPTHWMPLPQHPRHDEE